MNHEKQKLQWHPAFQATLQILINHKLSKEDNLWLGSLRQNLTVAEDIGLLARAYEGKEKSPIYAVAMDLIVRANRKQYEEGRHMCNALRELFADELNEREAKGLAEGEARTLILQICKKIKKGKPIETITEELEVELSTVSEICMIAQKYAPDYDCTSIYQELVKHKENCTADQ
ncbi:MAG: hypothetical protein Q4C66_06500 [Lachnospiraceae bacterium]|nr:hypothetical protein [Lachnospiraceae bacterium]